MAQIINHSNVIELVFSDTTHFFEKRDLSIQINTDVIIFKDSQQVQKVRYSDISVPETNNIDSLAKLLLGYKDSIDSTGGAIELEHYLDRTTLDNILCELQLMNKILKKIYR